MHEDIIEQKGETTSQMGGSQACYVPWHEIHLSTIMVLMMMVMTVGTNMSYAHPHPQK